MKYTLALLLLLSACAESQKTAGSAPYFGPAALLKSTTSTVSVPLLTEGSIHEIISWSQKGMSKVTLQCEAKNKLCAKTLAALQQRNIPVHQEASAVGQNVAIITTTVATTANCDARYVDNSHNVKNLNHSSLGCATSSNMLNMITNTGQITNPQTVGDVDAEKSINVYKKYQSGETSKEGSGSLLKGAGSN